MNNGVIGVAGSTTDTDLTNTRAPSLRDVFNNNGVLNGPLMHDGSFTTMLEVVNHYDAIPNNPANTNLDPLLAPGGIPQNLNLTQAEKDAVVAFMQTLSGTNVYTDERWSTPFDLDGSIDIIGGNLGINSISGALEVSIYPNPAENEVYITVSYDLHQVVIYNVFGQEVRRFQHTGSAAIDVATLSSGIYLIQVKNMNSNVVVTKKLVKN